MGSSLYILLVLSLMPAVVRSACYADKLKVSRRGDGSMVMYCLYRGIKLGEGSSFENLVHCEKVTCTNNGLSVCGTGIYAGVAQLPESCERVNDVCVEKIIQKPNTTEVCPNINI